VLIADELTPSLAAQVDWTKVRGFATDAGSRTYHTAILARSLEVPASSGCTTRAAVQAGQLVVIDGSASDVIVDPTTRSCARARQSATTAGPAAEAERRRPATTADGVRSGSTRTSSFPTTWRPPAMRARKESASIGPSSSSWPAALTRSRTKTASTRSIARCWRGWRRAR
jgi:hypothetical protein